MPVVAPNLNFLSGRDNGFFFGGSRVGFRVRILGNFSKDFSKNIPS
jgi:hypothetical protein